MAQRWLWYGWGLIAAFAWYLGGDQSAMIHRCLAACTETPTELWWSGWLESLGGRTWWDAGCWRLSWLRRLASAFGWDVLWGGIGLSMLLLCAGWKLSQSGFKETLALALCAGCFVAVGVGYGSSEGVESFAWCVFVGSVWWNVCQKDRWLGSLLLGLVLIFPLSVGGWWVLLAMGWACCVLLFIRRSQEPTESGHIRAVRSSVVWSCLGGLCLGILLSGWGWWRAWSQQQTLQGIAIPSPRKRQAQGGALGGELQVAQEQTKYTANAQENPTKRIQREQAQWSQLLRLLRSLRAQEGDALFRIILLRENLLPWGWEGSLEIGALRMEGGTIAPHALRMIHLIQTGQIVDEVRQMRARRWRNSSQTAQHRATGSRPVTITQQDLVFSRENAHLIGRSWDRIVRWDLLDRWGVHWFLSPYAIRVPKGRFVLLRSIRIEDQRWWLYRRPTRPMESWPLRRVRCVNDNATLWKSITAHSLATDEAWVLGCYAKKTLSSAKTTQPSLHNKTPIATKETNRARPIAAQKTGTWWFVSRVWHPGWRAKDDRGVAHPLRLCDGAWSCVWLPKDHRLVKLSFVAAGDAGVWNLTVGGVLLFLLLLLRIGLTKIKALLIFVR